MMSKTQTFRLAIICGGPSLERGISLNSARSVMDHLKSSTLEIIPLYVDSRKRFYRISCAQLYSNTPADFDFKLNRTATLLDDRALQALLQSVDLVFPVIHGPFGEDGELQALLESGNVPFVGHSSATCRWMFPKHQARETLGANGFAIMPQLVVARQENQALQKMIHFFQSHDLQRAIVKPAIGGSSLDVYSVAGPQEAWDKVQELWQKSHELALLEPFCQGKEFTLVVFENFKGEPVALVPTEVELDYANHEIFDFRKKYLPTNQAAYHTPPRFSAQTVANMRLQAEQIFQLFGMRDFVRLDGWVMPDGTLYFTDINPISGLEQNSFLFRQAALIGMTHRQALDYIVRHACQRYGIEWSLPQPKEHRDKKPVFVLFGNHNAERQVSLMSGTNVWLKLLQSPQHAPSPFFLDPKGSIWQLPYAYTLNHTVEEIYANCLTAQDEKEKWHDVLHTIQQKLGIEDNCFCQPQRMSLKEFLIKSKQEQAFVFIAMHGGEGENGTLQKHLEEHRVPFNGSASHVSALCMDKFLTGKVIEKLGHPSILSTPKKVLRLADWQHDASFCLATLWQSCCQELGAERLIVKPRCDGCSAGIVVLQSVQDFERYCRFLASKVPFIPAGSFVNQTAPVEMPIAATGDYLFEPYIETDAIVIENQRLKHVPKQGWIELTVGVLEHQGKYCALNPSITVAEGSILSLEEKFQGGTGINLTPPPEEILSAQATQKIKQLVAEAAQALQIENYARLDIFFNRVSEKLILIEANTLPGLTPSTVIYHQGLAENPPLPPMEFLDKIIASKLRSCEST